MRTLNKRRQAQRAKGTDKLDPKWEMVKYKGCSLPYHGCRTIGEQRDPNPFRYQI